MPSTEKLIERLKPGSLKVQQRSIAINLDLFAIESSEVFPPFNGPNSAWAYAVALAIVNGRRIVDIGRDIVVVQIVSVIVVLRLMRARWRDAMVIVLTIICA